ncbi:MAG: hypothetical protein AB1782_12725 [Cyanobacteriota bacterium]
MQQNSNQRNVSSEIIKKTLKSYLNKTDWIDPKFFGKPSMMDFIKDMENCNKLGIEFKGKTRSRIKAEILSSLTGQTIESMFNFYNSQTPEDYINDRKKLEELGLIATDNIEINKALLINAMIDNII